MPDIEALEIPKWGMTMKEGTIDTWHIAQGDSFNRGDKIVTIESTKVSNELEAPFSGTLRRIIAHHGKP